MFRFLRLARLYSTKPSSPANDLDAPRFLQQIGRNMSQYAEHFDSFESLMNAKGSVLKNKGIDTRDRRYLLGWIERYKQGRPLEELKRGKKKWGGERNRRANRAAFYGRKAAEERGN